MNAPAAAVPPQLIHLPRTSGRQARDYAHLKLLTRVRASGAFASSFEGLILAPGALIAIERLGDNPVILECAGPVGTAPRGKPRDVLWILWRLDGAAWEWVEIARAQSVNADWTMALREPAIAAMHAERPKLVDVSVRGLELAGEIMLSIDDRIEPEVEAVKLTTLELVYVRVAGRLAQCA